MTVILVLSISGCKTSYKSAKTAKIDETINSTIKESDKQLSVEDLQRMVREKENWHLVIYDTTTEPDTVTGRPKIKAEAWGNKETESHEEQTKTVTDEKEITEHTEQEMHKEEKKETDMSMKAGPDWWQMLALGAGAMLVVLLILAIRKATKI